MTAHEKFLNRELAIKDKKIDELKKHNEALTNALRDLYSECKILIKQTPLKDMNMFNPKYAMAYKNHSDRMIKAEQALNPKT